MHAIPDPAQRPCLQVFFQICHVQTVSCAAAQVPHDKPLVAQAMMEQWVNGALKGQGRSGIVQGGALKT